jgi:hypothetical protein
MNNDGTKSYDHHHDGSSQIQGSCIRDFRNKPFPIRLKIQYINQVLTVRNLIQEKNFFFIKKIFFVYLRFILIMDCHKMIMHLNCVHVLNECNYLQMLFLV